MGIGIGMRGSSSTYDKKPNTVYVDRVVERVIEKLPNPDPFNWILEKSEKIGDYLIVLVVYPDCTNYEGRKIMLYEGATVKDLRSQRSLDPHFSSNKEYFTPIARFEPTEFGWEMATKLAKGLYIEN